MRLDTRPGTCYDRFMKILAAILLSLGVLSAPAYAGSFGTATSNVGPAITATALSAGKGLLNVDAVGVLNSTTHKPNVGAAAMLEVPGSKLYIGIDVVLVNQRQLSKPGVIFGYRF